MPCGECQKTKSRPVQQLTNPVTPEVTWMPSVPNILENHAVSLLICAKKQNVIIQFNPISIETEESELSIGLDSIIHKSANPLSIAYYDDTIAIANNQYITLYKKHTNTFNKFNILLTNDLKINDLTITPDGEVLFVNSLFSCVSKKNTIHNFVPMWTPDFISDLKPETRCQLNGAAYATSSKPTVVSALSSANRPYKVANVFSGTVMESEPSVFSSADMTEPDSFIDYDNFYWHSQLETSGILVNIENGNKIENLCLPQSPRWYNDTLYFLNSGTGELCKVVDNEVHVVSKFNSFAQGLDFVGNFAFIGISPVYENGYNRNVPIVKQLIELKNQESTINNELARDDLSKNDRDKLELQKTRIADDLNEMTGCGVWIVDILRGEAMGYIQVDSVSEINDVKLIPAGSVLMLDTPYRIDARTFKTPTAVYRK